MVAFRRKRLLGGNVSKTEISLATGILAKSFNFRISFQLTYDYTAIRWPVSWMSFRKGLFLLGVGILIAICINAVIVSFFFNSRAIFPLHSSVFYDSTAVTQQNSTKLKILMNTRKTPHQGYLITLRYAGQQTMASCALLSQQCWLSSFSLPIQIVEPFVRDSHLEHMTHQWNGPEPPPGTLKYGDLFNMSQFNLNSMRTGSSLIKPWEEFVQNAPRDIITVTITGIHDTNNCIASTKDRNFNCRSGTLNPMVMIKFTSGCIAEESMKLATSYLTEKHGFKLVKEVCFNCKAPFPVHGFNPQLFTNLVLGHLDPRNVTIIFNTWKYSVLMSPQCKRNPRCHYCTHFKRKDNGITQILHSSNRLRDDANYYARQVLKYASASDISLAVMVRVEWMSITDQSQQRASNCYSLLLKKYQELKKKASGPPFVAMDIGKFGSDSFNITYHKKNFPEEISSGAMQLILELYYNQWTFNEWQDSFLVLKNRTKNRVLTTGYVAAVQRELASQAECIIVMGGGHFQMLALEQHDKYHPRKHCVHRIHGCGYAHT